MKRTMIIITLLLTASIASADSITFHAAGAATGMTWNQSTSYAANVTVTVSDAAPVTTQQNVSTQKSNRVLEVGGDGRIDSVEVTYSASSNASVAGHSYVVTPHGVTYAGGGAVPDDEAAFVNSDNTQFGQFRALERIFDGTTIAIGSSFEPKKQDAEELLNIAEDVRLRSMALTLRSVSNGVAQFDISMTIDSDAKEKNNNKAASGGMSMTLDGTLSVSVSTSRPIVLDIAGPVHVDVRKPQGDRAVDGNGTASMRVDYTF